MYTGAGGEKNTSSGLIPWLIHFVGSLIPVTPTVCVCVYMYIYVCIEIDR